MWACSLQFSKSSVGVAPFVLGIMQCVTEEWLGMGCGSFRILRETCLPSLQESVQHLLHRRCHGVQWSISLPGAMEHPAPGQWRGTPHGESEQHTLPAVSHSTTSALMFYCLIVCWWLIWILYYSSKRYASIVHISKWYSLSFQDVSLCNCLLMIHVYTLSNTGRSCYTSIHYTRNQWPRNQRTDQWWSVLVVLLACVFICCLRCGVMKLNIWCYILKNLFPFINSLLSF